MPKVTVDIAQARTTAGNKELHRFDEQADADNKFLEIAEDYDSREGYVKTTDTATLKIYTFNDFTITCENVI